LIKNIHGAEEEEKDNKRISPPETNPLVKKGEVSKAKD
jgi:hypothetical protein